MDGVSADGSSDGYSIGNMRMDGVQGETAFGCGKINDWAVNGYKSSIGKISAQGCPLAVVTKMSQGDSSITHTATFGVVDPI